MKNFIFITLLFSVFLNRSFGQAVIADPAVNFMRTASVNEALPVDAATIPTDSVITLKLPVINYNLFNGLPAGTCKIKIGLGSKIILDPTFNLSTVNTSNYFHWTAVFSGGEVQITGDLIASLPANFLDTASFNIKGSIIGSSTITTNFLVTNHNSSIFLSDENGSNNNAALAYTIVERGGGPLPVTFTKLTASKEGCNIKVNFETEDEINVDRFELEVSKDGTSYEKVGQLAANNGGSYNFAFSLTSNLGATQLFIRIKSVDKDARYQYSEIRKLAGRCDEKEAAVILFPNPGSSNIRQFTVRSGQGLYNGIYTVSISDITGKLLSSKIINLAYARQFSYDAGTLPAGQYIVIVMNNKDGQQTVVKWQKN